MRSADFKSYKRLTWLSVQIAALGLVMLAVHGVEAVASGIAAVKERYLRRDRP